MKLNPEYILRNIAGEKIIIPTGNASQKLNGMITMNEVAAFVWENLEKAADRKELVKMVLDEFEVDEKTAEKEINGFLDMLFQQGFATEETI